jgi:hypothetical protein
MVSFFDMGYLISLSDNHTCGFMTEKYRSKPIIVDLVKLTVAYATGELFDYYLIGTWVRKIHFKDSERSLFFWHNNNPCTCRHNVANLLLVSLLCHFNRP